jgi:hypothetical protein
MSKAIQVILRLLHKHLLTRVVWTAMNACFRLGRSTSGRPPIPPRAASLTGFLRGRTATPLASTPSVASPPYRLPPRLNSTTCRTKVGFASPALLMLSRLMRQGPPVPAHTSVAAPDRTPPTPWNPPPDAAPIRGRDQRKSGEWRGAARSGAGQEGPTRSPRRRTASRTFPTCYACRF